MLDQGPILVPLDGSELAEGAIPYAAALAEKLHTHLVLITVWEGAETDLAATFPSLALDVSKAAQDHFTGYLEGIRGKLPDAGNVRVIVAPGDATEVIPAQAREIGARLIAIATHGRSGIGRWLYGSTAGRLLRDAPVPILVVGPHLLEQQRPRASYNKIMVPLDGSPLSEAAIAPTAMLAKALGASLNLVRVVRWAVQAYPYTLPDAYVPQLDDELEKGAKAYLQRMRQSIGDGLACEAFVVRGAVADGLHDVIDKQAIDLTVMTTHARSGIARATLGSVADRMLQSNAPVILIRPED
jgi:nucleotide-binding universal stress UspA family protein